ncbi:hypothetical protein Scani_78520 [Streptomyces caniferus]|uniref:Uncharacterized protein n=1 Tax=Streptomyces caniferus TaxID=285557 RepID=A0A640SL36_9ACTN|nr:hypothetical protein [Streptomyces caniferus]GFE11584.1 hypothetical protein Scani_78520 [Streptomyces caniferus]
MTTPRQPMRITYGGAPWAIGANEGPSPDVAAEITLHRTAHSTLAGHVSGASRQWATTALELAGFTPAHDGIHQLPTVDPDQTRQALHQLRQFARDLDVTVTLSPSPTSATSPSISRSGCPATGKWTSCRCPKQTAKGTSCPGSGARGPS